MQHTDRSNEKGLGAALDGEDLRIGVVQARFNLNITQCIADACLEELSRLGVASKHIRHCTVPGALEVPLALQALAETNEFDALIAIGCVIRGQTYHFELVSNESGAGITRVSLDHDMPIANAILTVDTVDQALARAPDKGTDAGRVAVEMANLMEDFS